MDCPDCGGKLVAIMTVEVEASAFVTEDGGIREDTIEYEGHPLYWDIEYYECFDCLGKWGPGEVG